MFADVVVNVPHLTSAYSYAIPAEMQGRLAPGHLVTVPLVGRRTQGIITALTERSAVSKVSQIESLLDPEPVLTAEQMSLASWISSTYLAPLIDCLVLMLPPGLAKRADTLYAPTAAVPLVMVPDQARGALRGRQLDRALPKVNWRPAAEALVRRGVLSRQSVLDAPTVRAKQVRTARLCASLAQVEAARPHLSRSPAKVARLSAVLDFLANDFEPVEVSWVYAETGAKLQDLKDLAEMGLVDLGAAEIWRDSLAGKEFVPFDPPELTPDQQSVWDTLDAILAAAAETTRPDAPKPALLHGVTGSGKTEIYLRALAATLARGQRALVLVPEIALTPQTVRRFAARFPGRVAVWHSELGEGERYDTW
ncbi:MAG: DEAD/DEAH box helicase, partial [Anaerolineales bacterium]